MAKPNVTVSSNLGPNLRLLMDQRQGLKSQMQVAKHTGLSQSSIGRILRGEANPSAAALNSIATTFGVGIGDLYLPPSEFAARHMSEDQRALKGMKDAMDRLLVYTDRRAKGLVPLLTWKQIVPGNEIEPVKWVTCPLPHSDHTYALCVQELGMFDPAGLVSFQEGDQIFVDQKVQPEHRSIVVVRIGDSEEATLRQIIAESGQWLLLQLNPSWPNRVAKLTSNDTILGTVTSKVQTFVSGNVIVGHGTQIHHSEN